MIFLKNFGRKIRRGLTGILAGVTLLSAPAIGLASEKYEPPEKPPVVEVEPVPELKRDTVHIPVVPIKPKIPSEPQTPRFLYPVGFYQTEIQGGGNSFGVGSSVVVTEPSGEFGDFFVNGKINIPLVRSFTDGPEWYQPVMLIKASDCGWSQSLWHENGINPLNYERILGKAELSFYNAIFKLGLEYYMNQEKFEDATYIEEGNLKYKIGFGLPIFNEKLLNRFNVDPEKARIAAMIFGSGSIVCEFGDIFYKYGGHPDYPDMASTSYRLEFDWNNFLGPIPKDEFNPKKIYICLLPTIQIGSEGEITADGEAWSQKNFQKIGIGMAGGTTKTEAELGWYHNHNIRQRRLGGERDEHGGYIRVGGIEFTVGYERLIGGGQKDSRMTARLGVGFPQPTRRYSAR